MKGREVTVTGPRGTLKRSFKHLQVDIQKIGNKVIAEVWWGTPRHAAAVRTVISHIKNMIVGVTKVVFRPYFSSPFLVIPPFSFSNSFV